MIDPQVKLLRRNATPMETLLWHDLTYEDGQRRTAWLAAQGFHVIRFWNDEVSKNLEGVVRTIEAELLRRPAAARCSPP